MSFDQKKNGNMENDELNIKSHLNTSLDFDGISVSEDLINRTLEAIKKQSQEAEAPVPFVQATKPERKVIPWFKYARNIAAVAAAGMILVLGINGLGQTGKKSDRSDTAKEKANSISYDMAETKQAAPESATSASDAGSSIMEFAAKSESAKDTQNNGDNQEYGISSEEKADNSVMVTDGIGKEFTTTSEAPTVNAVEGDSLLLAFREICPILPEEVQEITMIRNADQEEMLVSDAEEMKKFYLLMESYAYVAGDNIESKVLYTVTIRNDGGIFTMQIGEGTLLTSYSDGDALIEHGYQITGDKQILDDLEKWYQAN